MPAARLQSGVQRLHACTRIGDNRFGIQLERVHAAGVDGNKACIGCKAILGIGNKIIEFGADRENQIGLLDDHIGRQRAADTSTAQIPVAFAADLALARLRLGNRNAKFFSERQHSRARIAVAHAAARQNDRLLAGHQKFCCPIHCLSARGLAIQMPDAFFKEFFGVIIGFSLHILRKADGDRAGLCGVGQNAHGVEHGCHELFRALYTIPVAADCLERIVDGNRIVLVMLELLEHRVGLAVGVGVGRQQQHGDTVDRGRAGCGNHIERSRTDGRGAGVDRAAAHLLGECHTDVGDLLLVLALNEGHPVGILL